MNIKRFIICFSIFLIIIFSFFSSFQIPVHAIGGGFTNNSSKSITTNATSTTQTPSAFSAIKGVFIVTVQTTYSPHTITSTITDTQSDTYTLIIRSCRYECVSIWYANYTGTNFGANTITYTFNASTSASIQQYYLTGITNATLASIQTVKNNGTASTASVGSFTPKTNYACINGIAANTGNSGTSFGNPPNFWYVSVALHLGATNFFMNTEYDNNWASYGATTASNTMSPVSNPQWDMVVACFQTTSAAGATVTSTTTTPTTTTTTTTTTNGMSAGIVQVQNSSTTSSTFKTITMPYNPQKFDLLLDVGYCAGFLNPTCSFQTPTDNNGLTWHTLSTASSNNNKILIVTFYANFSISPTTETINQSLTVSSGSRLFQFRVFEITGLNNASISNFVAHSNSSTSSTSAMVTSFQPPINWIGFEFLYYAIGDNTAHTWTTTPFTQFNGNNEEESMQNLMGSTGNWTLAAYFPQWSSLMGTTTATITPNSATTTNWLELVLFLPTQTSGIVTNTLTSTTTTTTTNTSKTTTTSTLTSTTTTTTTTTTSTTTGTTTTRTTNSTSTLTSTSTSTSTITNTITATSFITSSTTLGVVSQSSVFPITYIMLAIWVILLFVPSKNPNILYITRLVASIFGIFVGILTLGGERWLYIDGTGTFFMKQFDSGFSLFLAAFMTFANGAILIYVFPQWKNVSAQNKANADMEAY